MSPPRPHRRTFLTQLALLGVGGAAIWAYRERVLWPDPKVSFPNGGGESGWLPLPLPGGLVDLPARLGGLTLRAVVDSGAEYSAIDATLAQRLGLKPATPIPLVAFGVSGQPSITRAVSLDLEIGEGPRPAMSLSGLRAATLGLHGLSGLTRQPFSLLLGRDFLRAVIADIDFPRGAAAFFRPDAWRPPPSARQAMTRSHAGALMLPVQIEDAAPIEVMVDTGATGALALSQPAAEKAGLLNGRPVHEGQSVTLGGVGEDRTVVARQVRLAGETLREIEVQVYSPALQGPIPDGLLGLGVLRSYRVGLDAGGGRLFLTGPERAPQRPKRHLVV